jgi:hypothetical protein
MDGPHRAGYHWQMLFGTRHLAPALCLSAALAMQPAPASAQGNGEAPSVSVTADAALGGNVNRGHAPWIVVTLENHTEERSVILDVSGGSATRQRRLDLGVGATKRLGILAPSTASWNVNIRVLDAETRETLGETTAAIKVRSTDDTVIAYVGRRPPGLRAPEDDPALLDGADLEWEQMQKHTARVSPRLFPESWTAWSGIDALYWPHPKFDRLSAPQAAALEGWILTGGHLVVAVDDGWRSVAAHDLARLLPAELNGVEIVTGGQARQLMGENGEDDNSLVSVGGHKIPVASVTPRPGAVDFPLLPHVEDLDTGWTWPVGDGRVSLVAADIARTDGTLDYDAWAALLTHRTRPLDNAVYQDLLSIDEPKLDLNPLLLIVLLLLYLALIGPVDFYVLRHFKRQELTLITYPVIIIVFSGLAWLALAFSVDSSTFLTRTEIVHWHLGSDAIEGRPDRGDPAAGKAVRFLIAGYFPTRRQRVNVRAPEGFTLDGEGPRSSQMVTRNIVYTGPPDEMAATVAAYALASVAFSQISDWDTAPIRVVGTSPPVVHNRLPEDLGPCWMRDGLRATTEFFSLPANSSSRLPELTEVGSDEPLSIYSAAHEYSTPQRLLTALAPEINGTDDRGPRSEIICVSSAGTDIHLPGLDAEKNINHRLLRFVF